MNAPWVPRTLALPAIVVAALPKCPVCVMVVLGALGLGHSFHERVFILVQGAVLVLVVSLLTLRRGRAPLQLLHGAAGGGVAMLGATGLAPPEVGYAGAILLAAVWLVKPAEGRATPCACASPAASPSP